MIKRRTIGATLLAMLVLVFAAASLMRVFQSIQKWEFFAELLPIWPGYFVITGLVWFLIGAWLAWKLWAGRRMGLILLVVVVLYSLNYWLEKYWLALTGRAEAADGNWAFALMVNVLILAWSIWELYRPGFNQGSEERNEQQSEDRTLT